MSGRIQLAGNILLGPDGNNVTNYSNDIASLLITRRRPGVPRRPTFGDPQTKQKAGADEYQVAINLFHDEGDPLNVWAEFWDAQDETEAELFFSGTFKSGDVGPTNPKFTGFLTIVEFDAGGTVGQWKEQNKTFPAHTIVGPLYSES